MDLKSNMKKKCDCPIYCRFCGVRLKKDHVGHYCPSENCSWSFGVDECTKKKLKKN